VGGEGVFTEDLKADGHDPVGQGRLLDVADAVDLAGDPVAAVDDVLGGLGVGGVDVVEQGRGEERADLHSQEDGGKEQPGGQRRGAHGGALVRRVGSIGRDEGHLSKDNSRVEAVE